MEPRAWVSAEEFELFIQDATTHGWRLPKKLFNLEEILTAKTLWGGGLPIAEDARSSLFNLTAGGSSAVSPEIGVSLSYPSERRNCRGLYNIIGYYRKCLLQTLMHHLVSPAGGVIRAPETPLWFQGVFLANHTQSRNLFLNPGFQTLYGRLADWDYLNRLPEFVLGKDLPEDRIYWAPYPKVAEVLVWDQSEATIRNSRLSLHLGFGVHMSPVRMRPLYEYRAEEVLGWLEGFAR